MFKKKYKWGLSVFTSHTTLTPRFYDAEDARLNFEHLTASLKRVLKDNPNDPDSYFYVLGADNARFEINLKTVANVAIYKISEATND